MSQAIKVKTPCKINLHLGVHPERDERGYHKVDSIMVPVALFDEIEITEAPALEVIHEPALEVAPEKTTVWRAATLLAQAVGREPNFSIHVKCQIPERAGLGGSSADAGAVLRGLAQLWDLFVDDGPAYRAILEAARAKNPEFFCTERHVVDGLDGGSVTDKDAPEYWQKPMFDPRDETHTRVYDPRVLEVARKVGADVSFFLNPKPGLYTGAGDILCKIYPYIEFPLVLVMPTCDGGSTKETYDEFDRAPQAPGSWEDIDDALGNDLSNYIYDARDAEDVAFGMFEGGRLGEVCDLLSNNLAGAAYRLSPEVKQVGEWLQNEVSMCEHVRDLLVLDDDFGRPMAIYGHEENLHGCCCDTPEAAEELARRAREDGLRAWATESAGTGALATCLTGSGACSYAICDTHEAAEEIARHARELYGWRAWATKTVGTSAEFC